MIIVERTIRYEFSDVETMVKDIVNWTMKFEADGKRMDSTVERVYTDEEA